MRLTRKEIMELVMKDEQYSGIKDYLNAAEALQNLIEMHAIEGNDEEGYEVTSQGMIGLIQKKPRYEDEEVPK